MLRSPAATMRCSRWVPMKRERSEMRRCAEASANIHLLPVDAWGPSQSAYRDTATKGSPSAGVTRAADREPGRLAARPSSPLSPGTARQSSPLRRDPRASPLPRARAAALRPGVRHGAESAQMRSATSDGGSPASCNSAQVRVRVQQPAPGLVPVRDVPGEDLHGRPPPASATPAAGGWNGGRRCRPHCAPRIPRGGPLRRESMTRAPGKR